VNLTHRDRDLARLAGAVSRSLDQDHYAKTLIVEYLRVLDQQDPKDRIFRALNTYSKSDRDMAPIVDAFSRSQIKSKIWLIEQLAKLSLHYDHVLILAGWFGQIKTFYDRCMTYKLMRIVDVDESACEVSDYVFNLANLENHKVKSIHADINALDLHKNGYLWTVNNFKEKTSYEEKFLPDLIINTSAEHMTEDWFFQIKFKELESDPIVAIQSNNLFDIDEHVNCVHSIDHMLKKYPMREVLYAGELQLKGYKRVMIIGRP